MSKNTPTAPTQSLSFFLRPDAGRKFALLLELDKVLSGQEVLPAAWPRAPAAESTVMSTAHASRPEPGTAAPRG